VNGHTHSIQAAKFRLFHRDGGGPLTVAADWQRLAFESLLLLLFEVSADYSAFVVEGDFSFIE